MDHIGAKVAQWCPRWRLLGRFEADLGSILELFLHMGQVAKVVKNNVFFIVFAYFGVLGVA